MFWLRQLFHFLALPFYFDSGTYVGDRKPSCTVHCLTFSAYQDVIQINCDFRTERHKKDVHIYNRLIFCFELLADEIVLLAV